MNALIFGTIYRIRKNRFALSPVLEKDNKLHNITADAFVMFMEARTNGFCGDVAYKAVSLQHRECE